MDIEDEAIQTVRNANFPIYLVPPSSWPGDVYFKGAVGTTAHPLQIRFLYVDDAGSDRPPRGIEITTTGSEGLAEPPLRDLLDERCYRTQTINFMHGFSPVPEHVIPGAVRYDQLKRPQAVTGYSAGPRSPLPPLSLRTDWVLERVAFDEHPQLRMCRIDLGQAEIIIMAWAIDDEALVEFARHTTDMRPGTPLFQRFEASERASWERIREARGGDI